MEDYEKLKAAFKENNTTTDEGLFWLIDCWVQDYVKGRPLEYKLEGLLEYIFLKGYFFDKR